MKIYATVLAAVLWMLLGPGTSLEAARSSYTPRLPDATLLVGSADPFFLEVTTPRETLRILPERSQPENRNYSAVYPSISRDGRTVAAARLKVGGDPRRIAVATYSITEKKWSEYSEGNFAGRIAISPDGSKLAFSASSENVNDSSDEHLHIVDRKTGREQVGPEISRAVRAFASWSPDSRHLVYNVNYEIKIWDSQTGKVSKISEGTFPSWSPSGEWIAYLQGGTNEYGGTRCMEIHPDGTGEATLVQLPRERGFVEPPVWSPDSKAILLNELADFDKATVNVHMLDLKTHELKTIFKNVLPVLGWAETK